METRIVRLKDFPFLLVMTHHGMCWQGADPDREIIVVAKEGGCDDWTAYYETPDSGQLVAQNGDKLPRVTAEAIFPAWAKRLTWRY